MSALPGRPVEPQVCVYCASSRSADPEYREAAFRLGVTLAQAGIGIVYGGGSRGSMGALADGALSRGGRVRGILPRFMGAVECGHSGITELTLVEDIRTRKHLMLSQSQAAIALPGGSGTLDELLEAITLKRLGLYLHPIVLVNTRNYFRHFIELMRSVVEERFMHERHLDMWQLVDTPEEVPAALEQAQSWSPEALSFASV